MSSDLNILVAFPYMKKEVIRILSENQERVKFLLDSGAFTAWKAGKTIEVEEYCDFISSLPFKPWRYFALDVVGDPEKTFKNYEKMLKLGFNPVPIFTRGDSLDMLNEYYQTSDVVALGGLVGTKGNKGFVKALMKEVGDRKVHWLGFNAKEFISHYKPYMCDSSSWSSAFRYASAKVYVGGGRWIPFTKMQFAKRPSEEVLNAIRSCGVDPKRLAINSEWSNGNREKEFAIETLTHRTWVKYQQDLFKHLGTTFFLACSTEGQVRLMLKAYNFWEEK